MECCFLLNSRSRYERVLFSRWCKHRKDQSIGTYLSEFAPGTVWLCVDDIKCNTLHFLQLPNYVQGCLVPSSEEERIDYSLHTGMGVILSVPCIMYDIVAQPAIPEEYIINHLPFLFKGYGLQMRGSCSKGIYPSFQYQIVRIQFHSLTLE